MAANVAKIDSMNVDWPLAELLAEIDFEAIADHFETIGHPDRLGRGALLSA